VIKVSEAIARILLKEGVECLFCYPANALIDACAEVGIRPVIARTERTLVNMADGYSRVHNGNRLAVVCVQYGPGAENALSGVAQAFADGTPMLVLPGGFNQSRLGIPGQLDLMAMYAHISRMSSRVSDASVVGPMFRRALTVLRSPKTGPVVLELPDDVLRSDIDEQSIDFSSPGRLRSGGDPDAVRVAAKAFREAKQPVILAGQGVLYTAASDRLVALAEATNTPVVTHLPGKSGFPEGHALAGGTAAYSMSGPAHFLLDKADLIVGIGSSLSRSLGHAALPAGKRVIQMGIDREDANKEYSSQVVVTGDTAIVLEQLLGELSGHTGDFSSTLAEQLPSVRRSWMDEWLPRLTSNEVPINPYRVINDLQATLDDEDLMVTHDAGNPRDQIVPFYQANLPRGYLGWGRSTQLGAGLGLAMGAALADRLRTSVYVCGDAAFGMCGMDVETASREKIGIMILLLNNSAMGGYERHMPIASVKYRSKYLTGDYCGVAAALGAHAVRVARPEEIGPAILKAKDVAASGGPAVIEFITREESEMPFLVNPTLYN